MKSFLNLESEHVGLGLAFAVGVTQVVGSLLAYLHSQDVELDDLYHPLQISDPGILLSGGITLLNTNPADIRCCWPLG